MPEGGSDQGEKGSESDDCLVEGLGSETMDTYAAEVQAAAETLL